MTKGRELHLYDNLEKQILTPNHWFCIQELGAHPIVKVSFLRTRVSVCVGAGSVCVGRGRVCVGGRRGGRKLINLMSYGPNSSKSKNATLKMVTNLGLKGNPRPQSPAAAQSQV